MGLLSRPRKRVSWRRAWRGAFRGVWRKARFMLLAVALLGGSSSYGLLAPLSSERAWNAGERLSSSMIGRLREVSEPQVRILAWGVDWWQGESWLRRQWRRWMGEEQRPRARRSGATVRGYARIIDGDSLEVAGVQVRLHGIDAPESRQRCRDGAGRIYACGRRATAHLRQLIGAREVACRRVTTDRYGRMVAVCKAGGRNLSRQMVLDGWAVAFVRYSRAYVREERLARQARRGLWRGRFVPPAVWRRMHRR